MNAIVFAAAMSVLAAQDVQADREGATQLYVKTVPPGAEVFLDGNTLGKSDGLFNVVPGPHKLALQMDRYIREERAIQVRAGEITRVEAGLKRRPDGEVVLS